MAETLDDLRREIDDIDDRIHDLIMARTLVVERVRDVKKNDRIKIRPAREAAILMRLLDRHRGNFPKPELGRIWRELIVATLPLEGPFSVAVHAPDEGGGYWDLARDQYGCFTPMSGHAATRRVVEMVRSGEASVGVLPLPEQDDKAPWWPLLMSARAGTPRIIARLPFAGRGNARNRDLDALVICPVEQEPTGRDRTFLVIDAEEPLSRPRLLDVLPGLGLKPIFLSGNHDPHKPEVWLHLIEVDDFVAADDPRLGRLLDRIGSNVKSIVNIGGYAVPLDGQRLARENPRPATTEDTPS